MHCRVHYPQHQLTHHDALTYYFTLTMLQRTEAALIADSYTGSLIAEYITDYIRGGCNN